MKTDTLVIFAYFLGYVHYFWMITNMDEECK